MQLNYLIDTFFNLRVMQQYLPKIVEGFFITIEIAVAVVITGIAAGLALVLVRAFRMKAVNFFIVMVVDMLRAMPPLVLIITLYFALPTVGIKMTAWVSTWLALSLVLMAFAEEIFWAGILAIPKGQWEAARSTGLSMWQALTNVVMPQAIRMTIPPLTNRTIAITKGTALGAVVSVGEILYQAQTAYAFSYNASPLVLGALAYLVLFIPVVILGRWIETRFAWKQ
jgi:polar amino acid transport system permease protein